MKEPMNTIDQSGIRTLLNARFECPEGYTDKPLFIWQVEHNDGIQLRLVLDVMRKDHDKPLEARRCFRSITIADGKDYLAYLNDPREWQVVGVTAHPREMDTLSDYLKEVEKLIAANDAARPLIIYLPYKYQSVELPGEQYIFEPDFEQWAGTWKDKTIPAFIRANGDKDGLNYRWYNRFNDPTKGVSTPLLWLAANSFLNGCIRLTKNYRMDYGIRDLGDDVIRSAFQVAMKDSSDHISDDMITDFLKHVKSTQSPVSSNSENTNDNRDK